MTPATKLATAAVALIVAGVGGVMAYNWYQANLEEQRIEGLLVEFQDTVTSSPINKVACRALLVRLERDPQADQDSRIIRSRARLMMILGRDTRSIWRILEVLVASGEAGPAELRMAVQVLKQRHAETGSDEVAIQAARLAEQLHDSTNDPVALVHAWQMGLRGGDRDGMKKAVETVKAAHAESAQGRLVLALDKFYSNYRGKKRDVNDQAVSALKELDRELGEVPEELSIAVAASEMQGKFDQARIHAAVARVKAVLETFQSSVYARELVALGLGLLANGPGGTAKDCENSLFHLDWLLRNHADHPAAGVWRQLRGNVQTRSAELRKGD